MKKAYLGIDIGSISTKGVIIDSNNNILASEYIETSGNPIKAVKTLISLLKDKVVTNDISMTGEMTLRGKVLPIGGLKEKLIAATVNNIKKVFIPVENKPELEDISDIVKSKLQIILVRDYLEMYYYLFAPSKK